MKILLVDAPLSPYSWNQEPAPPLGLLYLAAAIKKKMFGLEEQHEVVVLPLQVYKELYKEEVDTALISTLQSYQPDIVGLGAPTPSTPTVFSLIEVVRQIMPKALIVLGGYQATVDTMGILSKTSVDIVVRGEGEVPFCELLNVASSQDWAKLQDVKGIAFRTPEGDIRINQPAVRIKPLDILPFPDRSLVPMEIFKAIGNKFRAGGIISSRGCPWTCNFCYSPQLWGPGVYRSSQSVVDEIEHLVDVYGINSIRFEDDTFTTNKQRVIAICDEIKKRHLKIEWEARTRIDLADEDMFVRMSDAGLLHLQVGVETIKDESLIKFDKGVGFGWYERFFDIVRKANLGLIITVIIGIPSETPEQMVNTVNWVKERLASEDRFIRCMYTPFPGTHFDLTHNPVMLSTDLSKYTMDIPLVISDLFSYDELVNVKKIADELMQMRGPHHALHLPIPRDTI